MRRFEHGGQAFAHPGCLDFSANVNPYGMPASARRALVERVDEFAAYPDPESAELTRAIAAFEGVDEARVVACAGATDAFARLCLALRPRRALVCAPCYSGYEQALERAGASVAYHDLAPDEGFVVGRRLAEDIREGVDLVFVANPNNPTGLCPSSEVIAACLERSRAAGATVVLDECFVDLTSREDSSGLVERHDNLVMVKACTKTFALAGLRLGYALVGSVALARRLREVGQPWAVCVPAQVAGVACLAERDYVAASRRKIARERARLEAALAGLGLRVVPGEANYLLFKGRRGLYEALLAHGVLIRPCGNFRGLDDTWYRVAVRTPAEDDRLMAAMREVMR